MPKRTKYIFIDDADLFTIDQINLPDKINNDRSYTDPLSPEDNPKYQTSLECFINRALSVMKSRALQVIMRSIVSNI